MNFFDYRYLAGVWKNSQTNYSLDDDNDVDFIDLSLFCADWLWQKTVGEGWMLSMSGGDGKMMTGLAPTFMVGVGPDLMLSTAAESLAKMPRRLADKSRKFYCLTPATTISAKQKELESLKAADKTDLKELLNWLDEVWLSGELKDSMTEDEYLEFRKLVEQSQ